VDEALVVFVGVVAVLEVVLVEGRAAGDLCLFEFVKEGFGFEDLFGIFVEGHGVAGRVGDGFTDWAADGVGDVARVVAGDLEAVEDGVGALGVDAVAAEGDEHHGEGELDGVGVLGGGEVELERTLAGVLVRWLGELGLALELAGSKVERMQDGGRGVWGRMQGAQTCVDGFVVEAERMIVNREGLAAAAAGPDVTAV
jgi:hypothetical protein